MCFDTVFLVQHYILYRHSNTADLSGKSGTRPDEDGDAEDGEAEPNERTRLM